MPKIPKSYAGGQGITEDVYPNTGLTGGDDLALVLRGMLDDIAALKTAIDGHITGGVHRAAATVNASTPLSSVLTTTKAT